MKLRKHSLLATAVLLLTTSLLYGQTTSPAPVWATIAPESGAISVTLPAGTTYRFGVSINNKWRAPVMVNAPTTFSSLSMNAGVFPFSDPDVGTVKELDVLATTAAPATTVSQIVAGLVVVPTSVPMLPGTAYTILFSSFANPVGTPANAPMVALANAPATMAYRTWQGAQMNLTIDGVTMVCTTSVTYTADAYTLNCTVPGVPVAAGSGQ
jgi:hypothetical protein